MSEKTTQTNNIRQRTKWILDMKGITHRPNSVTVWYDLHQVNNGSSHFFYSRRKDEEAMICILLHCMQLHRYWHITITQDNIIQVHVTDSQ